MILRWLDKTSLPVEMEGLVPETFLGRSAAEVGRFAVHVGNQQAELGDVFSIHETAADCLTLEGDLGHVRGIGRGMSGGRMVVKGLAGAYVGAEMTGGVVEVDGDVSDWAGAEMRGGLLRIRGNAGRHLGAAYPGSRLGMRDGVILVDGDVGDEAGRRMRRGLIAVAGAAGDGFGRNLIAGSLVAFGAVGRYPGAGMKRGTIALLGAEGVDILPTFAASGRFAFPFLTIYLRRLQGWGFPVPPEVFSSALERYNGDLADGGQGEILVRGETQEW
jgi:formylmethanofuran dehydrogenase subunit C